MVDPLRPLLINFDLPAVLLEPNPYLFESLTRNYARNRNAILLNAAFGDTAGTLLLNAVNPAKVREQGLPDWVRGLSSAFRNRNALGGHTIDPATTRLINTCIETITARMVSVTDLLQATGNQPPDIVTVDAEGMDFTVIDAIVRAGIKPRLLHFETQCLPPSEREQLARLLAADYFVVPFGNDSVAYRRDFLFAYCEHLYIDHGITTLFGPALKVTMQL
jgi:FkbM family methyltransferase